MDNFIYNNPNRKPVRRKLRKDATPQEIKLWAHIRNSALGLKFKRQYSIGGYIIDFYCPSKRFGVEIDGAQHLENKKYDEERTKTFNALDIKIIRFWNSEVDKEIEKVLVKILEFSPSPNVGEDAQRADEV